MIAHGDVDGGAQEDDVDSARLEGDVILRVVILRVAVVWCCSSGNVKDVAVTRTGHEQGAIITRRPPQTHWR